jgi:stress response protein YsnF
MSAPRSKSAGGRLVKYMEAEKVKKIVPVRREKARIEREPVTEANLEPLASGDGTAKACLSRER